MIYRIILKYFLIIICLFSCSAVDLESNLEEVSNQSKINNNECLQWLSAADINRKNGSYQDCVNAYNISLSVGCGEQYASQIYQWMGRAYIQLGKLDSAQLMINKGLRVLPEDLQLLNVAAFVSNKQNQSDDQLYYLDKKLQLEEEVEAMLKSIDSESNQEDIYDLQKSIGMSKEYCDGVWDKENISIYISAFNKGREDTYKLLSDYYKKEELYEEQVDILNEWQDYSPENLTIFKEKKSAYINLGKNPIDIDKERWENEPSNIKFGLNYIKKLKEESELEKIVKVSLILIDYDLNNMSVLENLGSAYLDLYNQDDALKIYRKLISLNNQNPEYLIEVSKIYLDIGEYGESIEYADKAVLSGSAEAYNNRAQMYKNIAQSCLGEELSMSDKAVYEMAWEDLKIAIQKGDRKAKKDAAFLEKNYITQYSDWFLNVKEGENAFRPNDSCYDMIDRGIIRREF